MTYSSFCMRCVRAVSRCYSEILLAVQRARHKVFLEYMMTLHCPMVYD